MGALGRALFRFVGVFFTVLSVTFFFRGQALEGIFFASLSFLVTLIKVQIIVDGEKKIPVKKIK